MFSYGPNLLSLAHHLHSARKRSRIAVRKRRRNQNMEFDELGELVPFTADGGKPLDKPCILRLITSCLKFQNFMKFGQQTILTDLIHQVTYLPSLVSCPGPRSPPPLSLSLSLSSGNGWVPDGH